MQLCKFAEPLTNRMCSNNCLVRLAVCYACLLAGFHTVGFTFPYIPPVCIEFSIGWPAPCTMLVCLPTVYPGCFPICNCLQLLTACASCLSLLVISCVYCILSLVTVCVLVWCIFWISISKDKFQRISSQFQQLCARPVCKNV